VAVKLPLVVVAVAAEPQVKMQVVTLMPLVEHTVAAVVVLITTTTLAALARLAQCVSSGPARPDHSRLLALAIFNQEKT
jgi:hypothetical protein